MKNVLQVVIVVALAASAHVLVAQTGNDLFQQALSKERAEGQLDEAIRIYERIVKEFANDRPLAAKVLLQIGRGYERLGKAEAQKAYERVVQDFADQRSFAAEARARLVALRRPLAKDSPTLTVRQLWTGDGVDIEGGISADGRYLSFTDWSTGDLAVRDLTSGKSVRLTNKGSWQSPEYADFSAISHDGSHVAYAWATKDGRYELRMVARDGSESRVLLNNPEVSYVIPHAWSPNGKFVATVFNRNDRTKQIALVSASDGSTRVLKSLAWRDLNRLSFSPDGRWIAYDFPPKDDSPDRDIYLLAADGSREVHLIDHPADDRYPSWTPDGKYIIFGSDRGIGLGIWIVRVTDGHVEGIPQLVKADAGRVFPLGVTRSGAFYYGVIRGGNDVYLVDIDPLTGRVLSAAAAATARFQGFNSTPDFSPDGERLAFISLRRPDPSLVPGSRSLVIRSLKTNEERVFPMQVALGFELKWSPDGRSLMVPGRATNGRFALYRVDAQSGDARLFVDGIATCNVGCSPKGWFPDGRSIYFVRPKSDDQTTRLVRRNVAGGDERELLRADMSDVYSFLTLSPDGTYFAGWHLDTKSATAALVLVPSAGGAPHELARVTIGSPGDTGGVSWSPAGRHVFYARSPGADKAADLWRVSIDGGSPQNLGPLLVGRVHDLAVHPDGTRVAFSTKAYQPEIWVIEHFLPATKATAARR